MAYPSCDISRVLKLGRILPFLLVFLVSGWNPVDDAEEYRIRYKASYEEEYSFIESPVNSVSITGLPRNVKYSISIAAICSGGDITDYSTNYSVRTQRGTIPQNIQVVSVTTNSASLTWETPCAYNKFNIQWRQEGTGLWSTFNNILTTSYTLTGLLPGTTYQFKLRTKEGGGAVSVYSDIYTFTTTVPETPEYPNTPNIIVYMLDDARYDVFQPNGGPEWFNTPNINRIANEGVNFELTTVPTPLCAPARAMMYTGLLPHKNGCTANGYLFNQDLPKISQIFTDAGYYTGFIGKYGNGFGNPVGFNWYAVSDNDIYVNPPYTYNGVDTSFPGNILDVYPQLALEYLNSVPEGQPFLLYYFDRAPHDDAIPRAEDDSLYLDDTIPFPENFIKYQVNYPSYYYNSGFNCKMDSSELVEFVKNRYRVMHAADENLGQLITWLEDRNQLDSTIIIFTSDNGYLYCEHKMVKKGFALDESFRIPLFIRYPEWFEPGTVVHDQFASLLDIPVTLLEIAEIENTFGYDGKSLRALVNNEITEPYALHQIGYNPSVPSSRGVRSVDYLYTKTLCNDTVY
ncbi:MAG: sulfatase-like hydrolase/transferase, partial [Chitinophagales bacterium]